MRASRADTLRPVSGYWTFPWHAPSKCLDEGKVLLAVAVVNTFAEAVVTMLPIPLIMRLPMKRRQQVLASILLCLGVIVVLVGCVRCYYVWMSTIASWDQTWWSAPCWICGIVEVDLAVVCADHIRLHSATNAFRYVPARRLFLQSS